MSTPYGRYRFLRIHFGISTAPEIFQHAMHRLLEKLPGVAVVMDDMILWGATTEEHDHHLRVLLEGCEQQNLKLNPIKCQILQVQVRSPHHELTSEELRVDPERVKDILTVPAPKYKKELQVLLGIMNYVSRFITNMSERSAPMRDLLHKDVACVRTETQQTCFDALKQLVVKALVLAFFQSGQPVTLSVDASQRGVGAMMLQNGHPIACFSRSLTKTQHRYAQVEKKTLAIGLGCQKHQNCIFGQPDVLVESDHRPSESIFRKPLCECPLRL